MINKRSVLLAMASIVALGSKKAFTREICNVHAKSWFLQPCDINIDTKDFVLSAQEHSRWCWAACIQAAMLLKKHNLKQTAIVQFIFPNGDDRTATLRQIEKLLSADRMWVDESNQCFWVSFDTMLDPLNGPNNATQEKELYQDIHESLSEGWPVIIDYPGQSEPFEGGHAVLLLKAHLNVPLDDGTTKNLFFIFDPYPYPDLADRTPNGIRVVLADDVLRTAQFAVGVQVWKPVRKNECFANKEHPIRTQ